MHIMKIFLLDSASENKMFSSIENRREWITSVIEDESKTDWNILVTEDKESVRAETNAGRSSLKICNNYLLFLLPNNLVIPFIFCYQIELHKVIKNPLAWIIV